MSVVGRGGISGNGSSLRSRASSKTVSNEDLEGYILDIVQECETHHQFIASNSEYLEQLRSRCSTSSQSTQKQIREVEEKLVKLFGSQLVKKRQIPADVPLNVKLQRYPSLPQWLHVVGLCKESIQTLCDHVSTLEDLLEEHEDDLRNVLNENGFDPIDSNKLIRALQNLKRCTENQMCGREESWCSSSSSFLPLYWDSWHRSCPPSPCLGQPKRYRECQSSTSSAEGDQLGPLTDSFLTGVAPLHASSSNALLSTRPYLAGALPPPYCVNSPFSPSPLSSSLSASVSSFNSVHQGYQHSYSSSCDKKFITTTPPPTPPSVIKAVSTRSSGDKKFPTTPPPVKKYHLHMTPSLGRSTSHESQLYSHRENMDSSLLSMEQLPRRTRLKSESGTEHAEGTVEICENSRHVKNSPVLANICSPTKLHYQQQDIAEDDVNVPRNQPVVPKSPRTPGSMVHNVQHRFTKSLFKSATCNYCRQKFNLFNVGLKCKECGYKCHRECEPNVPNSCGLPVMYLKYFAENFRGREALQNRGLKSISPSHFNDRIDGKAFSASQPHINFPPFHDPGSSSNTSSCNSSTPSSPAPYISSSPAHKRAFNYPDVKKRDPDIPVEMRPFASYIPKHYAAQSVSSTQSEVIDSRQSHDSDRTVSTTSGSGSTGTDDSDRTVAGRVDSQDSTISDGETADSRCMRQNSVSSVSQSLVEWDIPYDELVHGDPIGKGRFGTVYSGHWHGQVAIKELHMDCGNDEKTLESFKAEVSIFRNTRHENLVLFMGACMKPPQLAIVTSLCKGMTLYKQIHVLKGKFNMSKTIPVAQQISQGMGYLHARGIVHKDLKTKNIFLENGKVVITDFGLFNITRLCHNNRRGNWLSVPPGWLCYLAPEIVRSLKAKQRQDSLPFTTYSDVYAFGTVWFELLCGEWPHKNLPPEAVIWQVGKGMKPSLAHLQASREVKDILMACWSYRPNGRPEFSGLQQHFMRLPKKKLARSPSHPVHLSRSAESVF